MNVQPVFALWGNMTYAEAMEASLRSFLKEPTAVAPWIDQRIFDDVDIQVFLERWFLAYGPTINTLRKSYHKCITDTKNLYMFPFDRKAARALLKEIDRAQTRT